MSLSRELLALRKQGRSAQALAQARQGLEQNRHDIWFLRAYGWALYDAVKPLVQACQAKTLSPAALDSQLGQLMREFSAFGGALRQDSCFSQMLRLANDASRSWADFLPFARWAGEGAFSEKDKQAYQLENGKTIDSLHQRFMRAIARETARHAKANTAAPDVLAWGEQTIGAALQQYPDDQWLNYYQSQLDLAQGRREQAIARLMPVLQWQVRMPWPWSLLGDILAATRPDDALICLAHATQLAREELHIANTRIHLARLLASKSRHAEAAQQTRLAAQYRSNNGYKVPPELESQLNSDWYARIRSENSFQDLPTVATQARRLLLALQGQNLPCQLAVVDNINRQKALIHVSINKQLDVVLYERDFPQIVHLKLGDIIEVVLSEHGRRVLEWRHADGSTLPEDCKNISGTLMRRPGQNFAFVRSSAGAIHVRAALAESFAAGQIHEVKCLAVWSVNRQGKSGWSALRVDDVLVSA